MAWKRVFAVDPGVTSGVVCLVGNQIRYAWQSDPVRGWSQEISVADEIVRMWRVVDRGGLTTPFVIEDFVLRLPARSSDRDGLSPVRITALIMKELNWQERKLVVFQQPSQAKSIITDERLRAAGLWFVGKEHARDAARHALLFQRKV